MMLITRESLDVGGGTMSVAIVLGGWVVASVLFSPLIGRFLATGDDMARTMRNDRPKSSSNRSRQLGAMRRNVAIPHRRQAGAPRIF
jgi:hypothetical protein